MEEKKMPNGATVSSQGCEECITADLEKAGAYLPHALSTRGRSGGCIKQQHLYIGYESAFDIAQNSSESLLKMLCDAHKP